MLAESDADKFIEAYFPGYTKAQLTIGDKLSPKFLIVASISGKVSGRDKYIEYPYERQKL